MWPSAANLNLPTSGNPAASCPPNLLSIKTIGALWLNAGCELLAPPSSLHAAASPLLQRVSPRAIRPRQQLNQIRGTGWSTLPLRLRLECRSCRCDVDKGGQDASYVIAHRGGGKGQLAAAAVERWLLQLPHLAFW